MTEKEKQLAEIIDRRELDADFQAVERRQNQQSLDGDDRRLSEADRRARLDRRSCYRFQVADTDEALIVVREEHKCLDEDGEVKSVETVDSTYEVQMLDLSARGVGFQVNSDVQLEEGHVIRLAEPGGMHLVRVCNIRVNEEQATQQIGGELIDNLVAESAPLSILELLVDRREKPVNSQTTAVVIGALALAWSFVLAYTVVSHF